MISRIWHGWTKPENADAYEALLRDTIFPWIQRVDGYRGAFLLRREAGEEVEFVTITRFDTLEAVKALAGEAYETAAVLPRPTPSSHATTRAQPTTRLWSRPRLN